MPDETEGFAPETAETPAAAAERLSRGVRAVARMYADAAHERGAGAGGTNRRIAQI